MTDSDDVVAAVGEVAAGWRSERAERLARRHLERSDFAALADTGLLRLPVPETQGGAWRDPASSTRPIAEALRLLAAADPSPALVAAMHPAVVVFWSASPDPDQPGWEAQREAVFATALDGAQWGTVTSEPGSGGDIARTRSTASPLDDENLAESIPGRRYAITGDKHFGSGTGVSHYMLTTALPEGEDDPAAFFLDTRPLAADRPLAGHEIVAEWDGVGMAATQSHAVRLDGCGAVRIEWAKELELLVAGAAPVNLCLFTAVVLGVLDEAVAFARERLGPRQADLRAFEQTEWSRAVTEHWLAQQALEGMLRATESGDPLRALAEGMRGKLAVAGLAEQILLRVTRVIGGGSFSRSSPLASWFEDVRALGFLRPPWGLAFDGVAGQAFD